MSLTSVRDVAGEDSNVDVKCTRPRDTDQIPAAVNRDTVESTVINDNA